jgi:hypothetical protein
MMILTVGIAGYWSWIRVCCLIKLDDDIQAGQTTVVSPIKLRGDLLCWVV